MSQVRVVGNLLPLEISEQGGSDQKYNLSDLTGRSSQIYIHSGLIDDEPRCLDPPP